MPDVETRLVVAPARSSGPRGTVPAGISFLLQAGGEWRVVRSRCTSLSGPLVAFHHTLRVVSPPLGRQEELDCARADIERRLNGFSPSLSAALRPNLASLMTLRERARELMRR